MTVLSAANGICPACSRALRRRQPGLATLKDGTRRRLARAMLTLTLRLAAVLLAAAALQAGPRFVLEAAAATLAASATSCILVLVATPSVFEQAAEREWDDVLERPESTAAAQIEAEISRASRGLAAGVSVAGPPQPAAVVPFGTRGSVAGCDGFRFSREAR